MKLVPVLVILLFPALTFCRNSEQLVDCSDLNQDKRLMSGEFVIYPVDGRAVQVYCDMETDGGGWTVFQRRMDGSVGFHRPWDQYKKGFGDINGEYWLGLDNIHYLTRRRDYELLVEMSDFDGNNVSARYSTFFVGGEHRGYELHISEFINGGAGDSLSSHNGMKFSTFDKDQDPSSYNCAKKYLGGFWHHAYCAYGNPNGAYLWGYDGNYNFGVFWYYWKGYYYSMKNFSMKIRPLV